MVRCFWGSLFFCCNGNGKKEISWKTVGTGKLIGGLAS